MPCLRQHQSMSATAASLHDAIVAKDTNHAEQILAALVARIVRSALDALIPAIEDAPEVHRTVLPYRAWDMQEIVGTEHALTLLRQSLQILFRRNLTVAQTGTNRERCW